MNRLIKKYAKEFYKDQDGYWLILKDGYACGVDENHVVNGETVSQIMQALKEVKKI